MAEDAGSGSAGGLQSYDLRRKELTAVPPNVWEMKNLSVLNLYMNKIESLPPDLGTLALLGPFFFFFAYAWNTNTGKLTKLKALGLNENNLRTLPNELGQLTSLTMLDLRYNKLAELPATIKHLVHLNKLFLRYNRLEQLPEEIGCLVSLEMLSVRNNQLHKLPRKLSMATNLKILDISTNHLSKFRSVEKLCQLKDLVRRHAPLVFSFFCSSSFSFFCPLLRIPHCIPSSTC
jgi:internalin A